MQCVNSNISNHRMPIVMGRHSAPILLSSSTLPWQAIGHKSLSSLVFELRSLHFQGTQKCTSYVIQMSKKLLSNVHFQFSCTLVGKIKKTKVFCTFFFKKYFHIPERFKNDHGLNFYPILKILAPKSSKKQVVLKKNI